MKKTSVVPVKLFSTICGLSFMICFVEAQTTYDAATDFGAANPNSVWSYGYAMKGSLGTSFALFDIKTSNNSFTSWKSATLSPPPGNSPAIWKNLSSGAYDGVPPQYVSLHPGIASDELYAVLRFTAPVSGIYQLDLQFLAGDAGDTDARVLLNSDDSNALFYAETTTSTPFYTSSIRLSAGDILDIMTGPKGNFGFDNTPIRAKISQFADADGDGVNDYREGKDHTDPNDATSFNPLSIGLVSFYPFDNNANDESGYSNHAIINNAMLASDRFGLQGKALLVTTTGGGASSATNTIVSGNSSRTISFWAKASIVGADQGSSISWGNFSRNGGRCALAARPDGVLWFNGHYADLDSKLPKGSPSEDEWRLITFTYQGSIDSAKAYINDVVQTSLAPGGIVYQRSLDTVLSPLTMSGNNGAYIDDVRIYDRALSSAEVAQLYQTEAGLPALRVEEPVGRPIVSGAKAKTFGDLLSGTSSGGRIYTIRNTGSGALTSIALNKLGPHANDFEITGLGTNTLAPGASTTFSVSFTPTTGGTRTARISLASNDAKRSPFSINLSGFAIGSSFDSDKDGLNDAAEFSMSGLGFNWKVAQPELVVTLVSNINRAGFFTKAQYDANFAAGLAAVTSNPTAFNLVSRTNLPPVRIAMPKNAPFTANIGGSWTRYAQSGVPGGWSFNTNTGMINGLTPTSGERSVRIIPYNGSQAGPQMTIQLRPAP